MRSRLFTVVCCLVVAVSLTFAPAALAHPGHGEQFAQPVNFDDQTENDSNTAIVIVTVVSLLMLGGALVGIKQFERRAREQSAPARDSNPVAD